MFAKKRGGKPRATPARRSEKGLEDAHASNPQERTHVEGAPARTLRRMKRRSRYIEGATNWAKGRKRRKWLVRPLRTGMVRKHGPSHEGNVGKGNA